MAMSTPSPKRTGRRPGTSDSRAVIAAAARSEFAAVGYERATVRAIAKAAKVDPALVVHFFGSKEKLFEEVTKLPDTVATAMGALADGPRKTVGRRLATVLVGALENPV